jgi:hypothetical protein
MDDVILCNFISPKLGFLQGVVYFALETSVFFFCTPRMEPGCPMIAALAWPTGSWAGPTRLSERYNAEGSVVRT